MNHQSGGQGEDCVDEFDQAEGLAKKEPLSRAGGDWEEELHRGAFCDFEVTVGEGHAELSGGYDQSGE